MKKKLIRSGLFALAFGTVAAAQATNTKCPNPIQVNITNATTGNLVGAVYGGAGGIFILGGGLQNFSAGQTLTVSAIVLSDASNSTPRSVQAGFATSLSADSQSDVAQCQASFETMNECPSFTQLNFIASNGRRGPLQCSIYVQ